MGTTEAWFQEDQQCSRWRKHDLAGKTSRRWFCQWGNHYQKVLGEWGKCCQPDNNNKRYRLTLINWCLPATDVVVQGWRTLRLEWEFYLLSPGIRKAVQNMKKKTENISGYIGKTRRSLKNFGVTHQENWQTIEKSYWKEAVWSITAKKMRIPM